MFQAMRNVSFALAAILLPVGAGLAPAQAGDAYTTRYETAPHYGAVVTIEHGVRVYRPVPPTRHLIIDPRRTSRVFGPARDAETDDDGVRVLRPSAPQSPYYD